MIPQLLDGVELGTVCWQLNEPDIVRQPIFAITLMKARPVPDKYMGSFLIRTGDLLQVNKSGLFGGSWQIGKFGSVSTNLDRTIEMPAVEAMLKRADRAHPAHAPNLAHNSKQTVTSFILDPNSNPLLLRNIKGFKLLAKFALKVLCSLVVLFSVNGARDLQAPPSFFSTM